jgi:hypothetical protein
MKSSTNRRFSKFFCVADALAGVSLSAVVLSVAQQPTAKAAPASAGVLAKTFDTPRQAAEALVPNILSPRLSRPRLLPI